MVSKGEPVTDRDTVRDELARALDSVLAAASTQIGRITPNQLADAAMAIVDPIVAERDTYRANGKEAAAIAFDVSEKLGAIEAELAETKAAHRAALLGMTPPGKPTYEALEEHVADLVQENGVLRGERDEARLALMHEEQQSAMDSTAHSQEIQQWMVDADQADEAYDEIVERCSEVQDRADALSSMLRAMARRTGAIRKARNAERKSRFAVIDSFESARRQMRRLEIQRDEWKAALGVESGDIDTTPDEAVARKFADERESRFRWAEEAAALQAKLDLPCGSCHPCANWSDETWRRASRKPPHVHEWDEAQALLRAYRAREFEGYTFPDGWEEQVINTAYAKDRHVALTGLLESWRPTTAEATTPSDLQVPPSLGATTTNDVAVVRKEIDEAYGTEVRDVQ